MFVVDGPNVVVVGEEDVEPLELPAFGGRWARTACASSVTPTNIKILNSFER
jgi:hypothetical protein